MNGDRIRLLIVATVVLAVTWAAYVALIRGPGMALNDEAKAPTSTSGGPWIYGDNKARFTITEYADLECPYCKDYFPHLKNWIDAHPDVNLQWHHLPLSIHEPVAGREARLAECVGRDKGNQAFWEMVEMIYRQTRANGDGLPGKLDLSSATTAGLEGAVEHCAVPPSDIGHVVQGQVAQAASNGINATPTLIVTDNRSQRSIKLLGATSGDMLLSAVDWLSSQSSESLR